MPSAVYFGNLENHTLGHQQQFLTKFAKSVNAVGAAVALLPFYPPLPHHCKPSLFKQN